MLNTKKVESYHYLIHLCTHYYDEAKHAVTIQFAKDLNIIKLCDIREYIIRYLDSDGLSSLLIFAKKYNLQKQVYFTFYHIQIIYGDNFINLSDVNISNFDFLDEFGDNTLINQKHYTNLLLDRIFSCNNRRHLTQQPTFYTERK